jgi:hypothetical protein
MLSLTNPDHSWRKRWCAVIVLCAVSALIVSVATRYAFSRSTAGVTTSAHKQFSPQHSRQRLLKNAATWMPPVVRSAVFEASTSYPRIAPSGPPMPRLLFEKNLYNRPPPFLNPFLS